MFFILSLSLNKNIYFILLSLIKTKIWPQWVHDILKQLAYEYLNEIAIIIFVSSFLFSSFLFSLMYFSRFNVEYFLYFLICSFYFYCSDPKGTSAVLFFLFASFSFCCSCTGPLFKSLAMWSLNPKLPVFR